MMSTDLNARTRSTVSALQMAWLRELGIEKPWLPALAPVLSATPSTEAAFALPAASSSEGSPGVSAEALPARAHLLAPRVAELDTLEALAAAGAQCVACSLCHEREHVVVGEGSPQPEVMIIGEAPGDQEDRQGKPFVGKSGKLLDNMLHAIGRDRGEKVYMTNAIKCRPPGNRNPKPKEVAACRPFLERQIELLRPKQILLLGQSAVSAVLGDEQSLRTSRGKPVDYAPKGQSIPVVVAYHPAYLLRRPEEKAVAWRDLQPLS